MAFDTKIEFKIGTNVAKDDVLAPEPFSTFEFTGKNSSKIFKEIGGIIEDMYGSKLLTTSTKELKWSPSETSVNFYGNWVWEVKLLDAYSTYYIDIRVMGKEDKSTKEGDVSIVVYPYIITKVDVASNLQLMYWRMWSMLFYSKKRMQNIATVQNHMAQLKRVFAERYSLGVQV